MSNAKNEEVRGEVFDLVRRVISTAGQA